MNQQFFATCPKNLEQLLEVELQQLGAADTKQTLAGVYFSGSLELAYKACLWSRIANRILLPLQTFAVPDIESLYTQINAFPWELHIPPQGSIAVDFSGQSVIVKNTHFGALKVKDAVVDRMREWTGQRPEIDTHSPDVQINAYLRQNELTISLDLSGHSLHQRGYRQAGGEAPLKENLAAALLVRAGWFEIAQQGGSLLDPMCGSGTLLIEAAMLAADIAPGLLRNYFGFSGWLRHDAALWQSLLNEAQQRREAGLQRGIPEIRGYDASPKMVTLARANAERAGLSKYIKIEVRELAKLVKPTHTGKQLGLLITNPPYGERLSDITTLTHLYQHLGAKLKEQFIGWKAAVITSNQDLGKKIGVRAYKYYPLYNGAIPAVLLLFNIEETWFMRSQIEPAAKITDRQSVALSTGAQMFANRLRKNLNTLKSWKTQQQIQCYRLYDADMPEYAVAIDCYNDWVHVQEYAAPESIDPQKAQQRLQDILSAIPDVLEVNPAHIVLKERRRQKGTQQYDRLQQQGQLLEVQEGGCRLLVNLHDYLDTGLFLDHRPLRLLIQQQAQGKRFLNLFCYTAAATVHAAKGGARSSVSVDLSNTYINWAKKNLALNGFSESLHKLVQADCLNWLNTQQDKFDLILLDPPTFSNSKSMRDVLDIQRDHVDLICKTMRHLQRGGVLYFSTNYRRFKLDCTALAGFTIEDITVETIDKDFARNPKIHYCYKITKTDV